MPKYEIQICEMGEMYVTYEVEAESLEEAEDIYREAGERVGEWFKQRDCSIISAEEIE